MALYAVFDANNFYVSCERVFRPYLAGKPTVVANHGGVILARSNEAKALGVPMAAPLFKVKDFLRENNIAVISTNFALYTDISRRIATILHESFPQVEEYSIDESFVFFPTENSDIEQITKTCVKIREKILKWTGIPVSVGIAATKTLAKVAVKLAKKSPNNVRALVEKDEIKQVLHGFPVSDIWGIGRALSQKLPAYSIVTAEDLANQDPLLIRKRFSVSVAYTVNELNGIACFTVDHTPAAAKSSMCTESFTQELTTKEEILEKLTSFATRLAKRLRDNSEVASGLIIFTRGNRFHKERGYLALQTTVMFPEPTAYTPIFTKAVIDSLGKVFFDGARIKRAGIYLFDLMPKEHRQMGLFEQAGKNDSKSEKAMEAMDKIAKKWGRGLLQNGMATEERMAKNLGSDGIFTIVL